MDMITGPGMSGINKFGISNPNALRVTKIQGVVARIRSINAFNHLATNIDISKTPKDTVLFATRTISTSVEAPKDDQAKKVLIDRIENLKKANDPKTDIQAKAQTYAAFLFKLITVANEHNIFELLPNEAKQLICDSLLFSQCIASGTITKEDKISFERADDVSDYFMILKALQEKVLAAWDKVLTNIISAA
jgi:hypothetical protein